MFSSVFTDMSALWWCFTIPLQPGLDQVAFASDWQPDLHQRLLSIAESCCYQLERAPTTGMLHLQGLLKAKKRQRMSQLRDWSGFPRAAFKVGHWEKCRQIQASYDYCKKDESRILGPWEFGPFPEGGGQGARSDLDALGQEVLSGSSIASIAAANPGAFIRYHRGISALRLTMEPPLTIERSVFLLHGPPGCGKSHHVRFTHERGAHGEGSRLWTAPTGSSLWFDGYDGQSVALFDDFAGRASSLGLAELLKIIDIYPFRCPIKGGFVFFTAANVFFTTNIHPSTWYDYTGRSQHFVALKRRFSAVLSWKSDLHTNFTTLDRGTLPFDQFWGDAPGGPSTGHVERPDLIM